jgi:hypothetical protein
MGEGNGFQTEIRGKLRQMTAGAVERRRLNGNKSLTMIGLQWPRGFNGIDGNTPYVIVGLRHPEGLIFDMGKMIDTQEQAPLGFINVRRFQKDGRRVFLRGYRAHPDQPAHLSLQAAYIFTPVNKDWWHELVETRQDIKYLKEQNLLMWQDTEASVLANANDWDEGDPWCGLEAIEQPEVDRNGDVIRTDRRIKSEVRRKIMGKDRSGTTEVAGYDGVPGYY